MRIGVRTVPWMLAIAGLAVMLVNTRFADWPNVVIWLILLALVWLVTRQRRPRPRRELIASALVLLPYLIVVGWEGGGGWWLIPADLAWLVIELADRAPRPRQDDALA